jgi:hypothetical protein
LKFMFRKILLDKECIPDNVMDWSINKKWIKRNNKNYAHSSISSCDLNTEEIPILELNKIKSL